MKLFIFVVLLWIASISSAQDTYLIYGAKEKYFFGKGEKELTCIKRLWESSNKYLTLCGSK